MLIIRFIRILLIFLLFNNFSILKADTKKNIIENINNSESIKFDFVQITNDKKETGICYLKKPHYLKCEYNDKNQKELIVNRKRLVIYHKRYEKIYNYPLSKSYFSEILNKEKFSEMIAGGIVRKENDNFLINCFLELISSIFFSVFLMNAQFRLFSLNISFYNFKSNIYQVILIIISIPILFYLQLGGFAVVVLVYLLLNIVRNLWSIFW